MTFAKRDLKPAIGSEIRASRDELVDGAHAQVLRALLEERGVLVFPQIGLSDQEQVALARTISDVMPHGRDGILKVSLDGKVSEMADYFKASFLWHFDGFSDPIPQLGTLLSARRLSQEGGQTQFASTYAAYEALPAAMKARVAGMRVVHSNEVIQLKANPDAGEEQLERWRRHGPKLHPLVWTHTSGRKSLAIGETGSHIDGLPVEEGRGLLRELLAFATQPQFVYEHDWEVGDLVIWDNTGTLHRATPYPSDSGREMHRTSLAGHEAIA
jgi:alpha-ketoglutarate-dependent taurine dioxygenase